MKTCCNSKSLWIITIFIAWFFEPNCANTTKTKNTTGRQNVVIPPNCILLTQKIYDQHYLWSVKLLLTIVNLYQHENNQFILSVHSSNTVNFRVPSPDWPQSVLITLTSKIFNHLLILMNLYQHAKSQLIPSVHYSDTINFRVQRPD